MKDWLCKPTSLEEAKEIVERAVANGAKLVDKPADSTNSYEYRWNLMDSWGVIEGETCASDSKNWEGVIEILTIEQVREQFPSHNEKSVKWEDLKPNSIEWLEFAKSIGATHWHDLVMRFAKAGDGHSCMMFGDNGWEIDKSHVCPSRYPEYWEHCLIDYSLPEWNGEGYPHVGAKCFKDDRPVIITYVGKDVICFEYLDTKAEQSVYKTVAEFTIEKSERELWVEDAINVMKEVHTTLDKTDASSEQKYRLCAEAIYDKMIEQK